MNKSRLAQVIGGILLLILNLFAGKTVLDQHEQIASLQSLINAPADAPAAIVQSDGKVEVVYRDRVIVREVPAEGGVRLDTVRYRATLAALDSLVKARAAAPLDTAREESPYAETIVPSVPIEASIDSLRRILNDPFASKLLTIKTWGTCFRPQAGLGFNGQLDGYLGAKVFYWRRLGITAGLTTHQAGIGVTYRLDKWVKPLRNTEIMGLYGIPFRKDSGGLYAGIGVNL